MTVLVALLSAASVMFVEKQSPTPVQFHQIYSTERDACVRRLDLIR